MAKIANRMNRIKPSATLSVTQRAGELRAQGVDVISFSAGEPDFSTPSHIVESAKTALDDGLTRYTPVAGIPPLREAVARESTRVRAVACGPDQTIVSVGAKHVLYQFLAAILDPGDEVIIPAPYWVSYPDQVLLNGGEPVIVETTATDGFILSAAAFKEAVTPKTKLLVLNTPSNPTGAVYSKQAVTELTMAAVEAGVTILSDEIYRDLVYGDAAHTSPLSVVPEDKRELVFVADGVSKNFAMTGWRIGYGIGHPDIIKAMAKIQGQSTSNPNTIAQYATLTAITSDTPFLTDWKKAYVERRDLLVSRLNGLAGVHCLTPGGAFYVLPAVHELLERMGRPGDDIALSTHLLEEAKVACVPGTAFGAPGHIRLSYATSLEAVQEGMDRIEIALAQL